MNHCTEHEERYETDCGNCLKDLRQSALDAGIPLSVVDEEAKLTDHFPKEYIEIMTCPSRFDSCHEPHLSSCEECAPSDDSEVA